MALASAAAALATAATALAEEVSGENTNETAAPAGGEPAKRRGRPPGSSAAPADPVPPTGASAGKSLDELRDAIKPLVEEGKGDEVKKVIAKYGAGALKDIPADKAEAFIKDIEAMKY